MFEQSYVVRSLDVLARERAEARSIRVNFDFESWLRRAGRILLRILISIAVGGAYGWFSPEYALPTAGLLGALILGLRWHQVVKAALPAEKFYRFFPASAETIWRARFASYWKSSAWLIGDGVSVVVWLTFEGKTSIVGGLALLPSVMAFVVWMTALPLFLAFVFAAFRPPLWLIPLGLIGSKESVRHFWEQAARFTPGGWLYFLTASTLNEGQRLLLGVGMLALGAAVIQPLAAALERRVRRQEEGADIPESAPLARTRAPLQKVMRRRAVITPPSIENGLARSVLGNETWNPFPGPQTLIEKLFWRTLNARQRTVAKVIWPAGFQWRRRSPAHWAPFVICPAVVAAMRRMGYSDSAVYIVLLGATWVLVFFAPVLPGTGFIFQNLFLSGRSAARCALLPVTFSEISSILARCQTVRAVSALWVGAGFGVLCGLACGLSPLAGAVSGVGLVSISYALMPYAMISRISSLMANRGKRGILVPYGIVIVGAGLFGLLSTMLQLCFALIPSLQSGDPIAILLIGIVLAAIFRLIGWLFLKLVLVFVERSLLDAVVKPPKGKVLS